MTNKHILLNGFNYFGMNVHIAYNSNLDAVWGCGGLQTDSMALEVKFDLIIEISNLNYNGIYVYNASNSFLGSLWGHGSLQMVSIASEVKFDFRFEISNLIYHAIHVHVAYSSLFGGLWGCGGLQMISEATYDLIFELSDLNYLCWQVSLATNGFKWAY